VKLMEAVGRGSYARRRVTPEDIYSFPLSAISVDIPRAGEWVVTSKALVGNWRGPETMTPWDKIGEFWHANSRMEHVRYLRGSEWRLVQQRDDWEPWEFFRYVVEFRYRDPRDYIVWDRKRQPRWMLG
jgi:hypothetical protein